MDAPTAGILAALTAVILAVVFYHVQRLLQRLKVEHCPRCTVGHLEAEEGAGWVPMSLLNPELITRTVPLTVRCNGCGSRFRLKDRSAAEYEWIDDKEGRNHEA